MFFLQYPHWSCAEGTKRSCLEHKDSIRDHRTGVHQSASTTNSRFAQHSNVLKPHKETTVANAYARNGLLIMRGCTGKLLYGRISNSSLKVSSYKTSIGELGQFNYSGLQMLFFVSPPCWWQNRWGTLEQVFPCYQTAISTLTCLSYTSSFLSSELRAAILWTPDRQPEVQWTGHRERWTEANHRTASRSSEIKKKLDLTAHREHSEFFLVN